jgi:hypothetical protein
MFENYDVENEVFPIFSSKETNEIKKMKNLV